jgi:hypothetical protein
MEETALIIILVMVALLAVAGVVVGSLGLVEANKDKTVPVSPSSDTYTGSKTIAYPASETLPLPVEVIEYGRTFEKVPTPTLKNTFNLNGFAPTVVDSAFTKTGFSAIVKDFPLKAGWQFTPAAAVVKILGMEEFGGFPGVLYETGTNLYYCLANDADGTTWNDEQKVNAAGYLVGSGNLVKVTTTATSGIYIPAFVYAVSTTSAVATWDLTADYSATTKIASAALTIGAISGGQFLKAFASPVVAFPNRIGLMYMPTGGGARIVQYSTIDVASTSPTPVAAVPLTVDAGAAATSFEVAVVSTNDTTSTRVPVFAYTLAAGTLHFFSGKNTSPASTSDIAASAAYTMSATANTVRYISSVNGGTSAAPVHLPMISLTTPTIAEVLVGATYPASTFLTTFTAASAIAIGETGTDSASVVGVGSQMLALYRVTATTALRYALTDFTDYKTDLIVQENGKIIDQADPMPNIAAADRCYQKVIGGSVAFVYYDTLAAKMTYLRPPGQTGYVVQNNFTINWSASGK